MNLFLTSYLKVYRKKLSMLGEAMALKQTIGEVNRLLSALMADLDKADKGNKAAAQRVRVGTIDLEKVAKKYRKESIAAEKKQLGSGKKAVKKKAAKKMAKKPAKKPVAKKAAPKKAVKKAAPKKAVPKKIVKKAKVSAPKKKVVRTKAKVVRKATAKKPRKMAEK